MSEPILIPKLAQRQLYLMRMVAIHGLIARIPPKIGDRMFEKLSSDWDFIAELEEWGLIENVSEETSVKKALDSLTKQFGRDGIQCYGFTQIGEAMFGGAFAGAPGAVDAIEQLIN